jgi:carbohydrate-selective porin OprB
MCGKRFGLRISVIALFLTAPGIVRACAQDAQTGPDKREFGSPDRKYLLGDWGGERSKLAERGVALDLHSTGDNLDNIKSQQKERFTSYNRTRGTIDIDLGTLIHASGYSFHITAAWQTGANMGSYLGLLANPTSLASANEFRLDSWWFQKQWLKRRLSLRLGQFAGDDTFGNQEFGNSFIFEPLGGPTENLSNTFESFDPPSTPALEIRVVPVPHFYIKSAVLSVDRMPYSNNQTGAVPQFHGPPVSVSEIAYTPGRDASVIAQPDNTASRKGYSGVYRVGASYNPARFTIPFRAVPRSGNYLVYAIASQALWRSDPLSDKGLDATLTYDWSPPAVNLGYTELTAGVRYNQPFPIPFHNTVSLGYVRSPQSSSFLAKNAPAWKAEHGVEFNTLLSPYKNLQIQPLVQYYANTGGGSHRAVILGFRFQVEY